MSDKVGCSSLMGNTGPCSTAFPCDKLTAGVGPLRDQAVRSGGPTHSISTFCIFGQGGVAFFNHQ